MKSDCSSDANSLDGANSNQPLSGLSLLVVEDQFIVAVGIEQTFKDAGAQHVTVVGSIEEAWEALRNAHFDAVLLDIRLHDGLSFPLATQLLSDQVPVVIHSGHAEVYHAVELPGAVFCPKPAKPSEIVAATIQAQQMMASKSGEPNSKPAT
ncbi:MAG: response regulator [Pseudomonadota bacterium]